MSGHTMATVQIAAEAGENLNHLCLIHNTNSQSADVATTVFKCRFQDLLLKTVVQVPYLYQVAACMMKSIKPRQTMQGLD